MDLQKQGRSEAMQRCHAINYSDIPGVDTNHLESIQDKYIKQIYFYNFNILFISYSLMVGREQGVSGEHIEKNPLK